MPSKKTERGWLCSQEAKEILQGKRRKREEYYKKLVCLRDGRFSRPKTESGEFSSRSVERGVENSHFFNS